MFLKKAHLISAACLILLSACAQIQSDWIETTEGNEFRTISRKTGENSYSVSVHNTKRTWNGHYLGGKEKFDMRKDVMMRIGDKEAKRICTPKPFNRGEPNFDWTDRENAAASQGLIGLIIGDIITRATSKDENIPRSMHYAFTCGATSSESLEHQTLSKSEKNYR